MTPWVFEDTPGSSEELEETYLPYVRRSAWIVWLVTRDLPDAVAKEIREAVMFGIPVLPFVLDERLDEPARALLSEVEKHAKWVPTTADELRRDVLLTLKDEISRLVRSRSAGPLSAAETPPPPPPDFTGRSRELDEVLAALDEPNAVVVVNGPPGVGKSALAHAVASTASGRQVIGIDFLEDSSQATADVLRRLLTAVGKDVGAGPRRTADLVREWQDAVTDVPVLLVIDDARSEDAVRSLLPKGTASAALLTARRALPGLEGARHIQLEVMDSDEGIAFLGRMVGSERVERDPRAAAELVDLCGGLPLALRISGGRLATRPAVPLADYAGRLRDERTRLEQLSAGDLDIRTSFNVSYSLLDAAEAGAFRALGWFRGPTIDAAAVSAAIGENALPRLEAVADTQLVSAVGAGRFEVHDLLRLFARGELEKEPAVDRGRAITDLARHYEEAANSRAEPIHGPSNAGEFPLAWLDIERANIVSIAHALEGLELWGPLCELVRAVGPLFGAARQWENWRTLLHLGARAAEERDDPKGRLRTTLNLGIAALELRELTRAEELLRQAEEMAVAQKDLGHQARSLAQQGTLLKLRGAPAAAAELTSQARELYRRDGDSQGEARALGDLANQLDDLDRRNEAIAHHREALEIFGRLDDRLGQALEHGNLAIAFQRNGDLRAAAAELGHAAVLFRALGASLNLVETYRRLGEIQLELDPQTCVATLDEGIAHAEKIADTSELATMLALRSRARNALGNESAIDDSRRAMSLLEQAGEIYGRAVEMAGAATSIEHGLGADERIEMLEAARAVFRAHPEDTHLAEVAAAWTLGDLYVAIGKLQEAGELFSDAARAARALDRVDLEARAVLHLAWHQADCGATDDAERLVTEARKRGAEVDDEELASLRARSAAAITILGTDDKRLKMRLRRAAALALEELGWIWSDAVIRLVGSEELEGRFGRINAEEICLLKDIFPEPGPSEPGLMFTVFGMCAQYTLMRLGVTSDGASGSLWIAVVGEWFPRVALAEIFDPDEEPIRLHDPRGSDIGTVGDNLGAVLAGSRRASKRLDTWARRGQAPDLAELVETVRAKWDSTITPPQLLQELAQAFAGQE